MYWTFLVEHIFGHHVLAKHGLIGKRGVICWSIGLLWALYLFEESVFRYNIHKVTHLRING